MELFDSNFEEEIKKAEVFVLVDFFAEWCTPCSVIGPILEKIAEDYKEKLLLVKANLDKAPLTAQKFGIDRIPTVVLFKEGLPVSGFVGLRPEPVIREWLEGEFKKGNTAENMIKEYEDYAREEGFMLNPDREIVKKVIKGLLENEKKYGKRYCPCRRVTGNPEEDELKICPCQWHKEEVDKEGGCSCRLFLKP